MPLSESRLRQFGGTSGLWGGTCKPLEDYTFDLWPINNNDLTPYLDRACEILDIKNQFRKTLIDKSFSQIEFQTSRVKFAEKYKNHIKDSDKIALVLNTQLSYLVGKNNNINHAICHSNAQEKKIKGKYFILSCGGIENSRLLLWTKNKTPGLLNEKLPIGKYWMNHPHVLGGRGVLSRKKFENKMRDNFVGFTDLTFFATTKKFVNEHKILSAYMYMLTQDVFRNEKVIDKEFVKDIMCVAPKYGEKLIQTFHKESFRCVNINLLLEQEPSDYKRSPKPLRTAKVFLEEFANFCIENDLGRIAIEENIFNLEYLKLVGDGGHHMGGTRMGNDKKNSVVNSDLRVHDVNNLYVNGSSNFVTGGYTNPTFSIVQLAIRLANTISNLIKKT